MFLFPVFPLLNGFRILFLQPFFQFLSALFQPFQNFRVFGQDLFLSVCHGVFFQKLKDQSPVGSQLFRQFVHM